MTEFRELAEQCARPDGNDGELYAETRRKRNFEWDGPTLKSVRTDRDGGAGLRIFADDRLGFAYANLSRLDADWLIDQARANRNLLPPDPDEGLTAAEPEGENRDDWYDSTAEQGVEERRDRVTDRIEATLESEEKLRNLQVEYEESTARFELYRNGSFVAGERRTRFSVSAWAVCQGNSDVQSGFQRQTGYRREDLDVEAVLEDAVRDGRRKLGASPPESRTGAVLLEPRASSGLLRLVKDMLDGKAVARGRSGWSVEDLGEDLGAEGVTVLDDPSRTAGAANAVFDAEGYRMEPVTLVDAGTLETFLTNQYVSNRLDLVNNHRAARSYSSLPDVGSTNFYLKPGENTPDELRHQLDSGPVVTGIQPGSGLDSVAGQFSVGASGYFVENGRRTRAFDEATLSGDVEDLLSGVLERGNDLPDGYSVAAPSLLVEELSLGGSESS